MIVSRDQRLGLEWGAKFRYQLDLLHLIVNRIVNVVVNMIVVAIVILMKIPRGELKLVRQLHDVQDFQDSHGDNEHG